jgi:hypothetical protein
MRQMANHEMKNLSPADSHPPWRPAEWSSSWWPYHGDEVGKTEDRSRETLVNALYSAPEDVMKSK